MLNIQALFAGYPTKPVLFDVSFSINPGQTLAIVGPNGSGKTTLLHAIARLLPHTGIVHLDDTNLSNLPRRQLAAHLALLSQTPSHPVAYRVYDTVMLGRYAHLTGLLRAPTELDKELVEKALNQTNLSSFREKTLDQLSGGEGQRVMLARVFAQNPKVILLDEWANHLDLRHQLELVEYLKDFAKQGGIVIGVMHDLRLAQILSDRFLCLNDGKIFADDCGDTLLKNGTLDRLFGTGVSAYYA